MTDPNYTALLLVVDRSGSMASIRDDMVGGLMTMLREQAAQPGLLTVGLVQFDDRIDIVCSLADPASVRIELEPRGMTALHDAVGLAVTDFGAKLAALPEHARPGTVQVVVVTDGHENFSHEWTAESVKALVTKQSVEFGWDFVYLGANQDAVLTGADLGFAADSSLTFDATAAGVESLSVSVGRYVTDRRSGSRRGFDDGERAGSGGGR